MATRYYARLQGRGRHVVRTGTADSGLQIRAAASDEGGVRVTFYHDVTNDVDRVEIAVGRWVRRGIFHRLRTLYDGPAEALLLTPTRQEAEAEARAVPVEDAAALARGWSALQSPFAWQPDGPAEPDASGPAPAEPNASGLVECPACGGTGNCRACAGATLCSRCGGTGWLTPGTEPRGRYRALNDPNVCPTCEGTSHSGRGRRLCPDCNAGRRR